MYQLNWVLFSQLIISGDWLLNMNYAFVNIIMNYAFVIVNSWPQQVLKYLNRQELCMKKRFVDVGHLLPSWFLVVRHTYCLINVSLPCVMQLSVACKNENSLKREVSVRNLWRKPRHRKRHNITRGSIFFPA